MTEDASAKFGVLHAGKRFMVTNGKKYVCRVIIQCPAWLMVRRIAKSSAAGAKLLCTMPNYDL
jgi:hypothetical protein